MSAKRLLGIDISDLGATGARSGEEGPELISLDRDGIGLSSFAQLTGKGEVIFGSSAFRQFLVSEIPVDNEFWYRLATVDDPSKPRSGSIQQPPDSDLAQAHLAAVFEKCLAAESPFDEVALTVPAHFKSENLGSLIQISRQGKIPVTHVIDSSLAALLSSSSIPQGDSFIVLDLHWNTADVVQITRTGSGIERSFISSDRVLGVRLILDRLVDGLGKRFIDECRFDPAARPEYAQELYNQLRDYLVQSTDKGSCKLDTAKGSISVDHSDLTAMIDTELTGLKDLVSRAISNTNDEQAPALFLSSRSGLIPGLATRLANGFSVSPLQMANGQSAHGALAFLEALDGDSDSDQPLFHTSVKFSSASPKIDPKETEDEKGPVYVSGESGILQATPATHLLFQGRVLQLPKIGEPKFVVGKSKSINCGLTLVEPMDGLADGHIILSRRSDGELEMANNGRNTTSLNGASIGPDDSVILQVGDVLELGDSKLQLMIVGLVDNDA
jgi:hypothetical protein